MSVNRTADGGDRSIKIAGQGSRGERQSCRVASYHRVLQHTAWILGGRQLRLWRGQGATLVRERVEPISRPSLFQREPSLLAIASGKGGVGKTFLSVNIALALRDLGHRCL